MTKKGTIVEWNLLQRVKIGEELPPLGAQGKAGESLGTYLRRKQVWQSLKAEAIHAGEELVPYTFRHRYAKRSHAMRIPIANVASAMGHTVEVHLQSYARFTLDVTANLYAEANSFVDVDGRLLDFYEVVCSTLLHNSKQGEQTITSLWQQSSGHNFKKSSTRCQSSALAFIGAGI